MNKNKSICHIYFCLLFTLELHLTCTQTPLGQEEWARKGGRDSEGQVFLFPSSFALLLVTNLSRSLFAVPLMRRQFLVPFIYYLLCKRPQLPRINVVTHKGTCFGDKPRIECTAYVACCRESTQAGTHVVDRLRHKNCEKHRGYLGTR